MDTGVPVIEFMLTSVFLLKRLIKHGVACVASVSNRVIAQTLEREQKKYGLFFFFLLSSQLSRQPRAEMLATQAKQGALF